MPVSRPRIGKDPERPKGWNSVIRAAQGNFDHIMGVIRGMVRGHNSLVDDVREFKDYTEASFDETATGQHTHQDTDEGHDGGVIYAAGIDHGGLAGLADDDHPQYQTPAEHTAIGDGAPHHAESHSHASHSGIGANDHHAEAHALDVDSGKHTGTLDSDDVVLVKVGTPTYETLQDMQNTFHSAGWLSGGTITADINGIDVTAGEGMLRTSASRVAELPFIEWSAALNQTGPVSGATKYVGVEYNGGSPQVSIRDTYNWNFWTDWPLGRVTYDGTNWHVLNAPWEVGDHAGLMVRQMRETMPFARDEYNGGLVIDSAVTNEVSMSAGALWFGLSRFTYSAIDTAAAGTFDIYYKNVGVWTESADQTGWPNTQYQNGASLGTLAANRWANLWWYLDASTGELVMLYGTAEYTTQAAAELEAPPTSLPASLSAAGKLLGRFIFQKSATDAAAVDSVWDTEFTTAGVTAHGDLSSVTADQHHAQAHDHTSGDSSGVLTADEHDSYSEYAEIATPANPAANKGRLYFKDDGAGKTQLVVLFSSGVELVLGTDP